MSTGGKNHQPVEPGNEAPKACRTTVHRTSGNSGHFMPFLTPRTSLSSSRTLPGGAARCRPKPARGGLQDQSLFVSPPSARERRSRHPEKPKAEAGPGIAIGGKEKYRRIEAPAWLPRCIFLR